MMGCKKYLILIMSLVSYFAFASSVDAELCDREHISQLKELANQVEVSYEYIDYSDEILSGSEGEYLINTYLITVNIISDELYIIHDNREYYYNQDNGGVVTFAVDSGFVNLSIHSNFCGGYKLKSETINLPKFNIYSYRSECKELEEYDLKVCDPWYQGTITDERFNTIVQEYFNDDVVVEKSVFDNISDFFKDNYLILIGSVVVICVIVFGIRLYKKRSVLE